MITDSKSTFEKKSIKHPFDFEVGYLVKSPCKKCETRDAFPKCIDSCIMLNKIHSVLANSISCSK